MSKLIELADKMEAELMPQYKLRAADSYGQNLSNNAWSNVTRDETSRYIIKRCADWLRARANQEAK